MASSTNALTVTYTIHAPVQEVFKAWITPQLLQRWGPERAVVDAKVGGKFRFETRAEGNSKELHVVTGEYRQLVSGHLLVKTWVYEGPMEPHKKVETLVSVNFTELEPMIVELVLTEEGASLADEEAREAAEEAWMEALKMLEILCSAK
jgi:uncharacterized protein YndB with AHSA1/START domain